MQPRAIAEASSHLQTTRRVGRGELFARFRELVAGKTALMISHRFSTMRMADQIVALEHGRVLEIGAHAELMQRGGRYAELFEMQAGWYRWRAYQ